MGVVREKNMGFAANSILSGGVLKNVREKGVGAVVSAYVPAAQWISRHERDLLMFFGLALIYAGQVSVAEAQVAPRTQIINQICIILNLAEGAFGALLMSVAGIVAVVGAAMGAYRASINAICVGAGAYLIRPLIMVFFGDPQCVTGVRGPTP
jgi:hypothetical protein